MSTSLFVNGPFQPVPTLQSVCPTDIYGVQSVPFIVRLVVGLFPPFVTVEVIEPSSPFVVPGTMLPKFIFVAEYACGDIYVG